MTSPLAAFLTVPVRRIDGSSTTLQAELGLRATVVVFVRHFG